MDFKKIRELWRLTLGGPAESALDTHRSYKAPRAEPEVAVAMPEAAFETRALIAKGGAGDVYRAHQPALHREVALKKLRESSPAARAGFIAEGVVLARLEHPNIVPVYTLEGQGSELALAMRLVSGKSWRDHLADEPPRPLGWHLEVLLQTCHAIAFAHHRGIIHNDLKPENVMVGSFGEVLVVDWGLAVRFGEPVARDEGIRHHSSISSPCGTPVYMAPELATGDGAKIGPWTDVYLLGAVLYEVLAGRAPHEGGKFFEVVQRAVEAEAPLMPEAAPAGLREICTRALAREPGDRFQSVEAFQEALRRYLLRRESLSLSEQAQQSLAALHEQLREGADAATVYNLFGECRFGFRQALRVWGDNPQAHGGSQEAIEAMVRYELDNGSAQAGSALIGSLPEPNPQLSRRLDAVRRARAEERAELGRLRLQENRAIGRTARIVLSAVLAVLWSALCVLHATQWLPATPSNHLWLGLAIGLVIVAGLVLGRRSFFANRYNRNVGIGALGINLGILLHRWLCQTLGFGMLETVVLENELFCLLLGLVALTVDWRFIVPASTFLVAVLVSSQRVAWAWEAMAGAIFCGLLGLGLAWACFQDGAAGASGTSPSGRARGRAGPLETPSGDGVD